MLKFGMNWHIWKPLIDTKWKIFILVFRRIINLHCLSAIYADWDTTKVQDIHFRPMLKPQTRLSHPSFSFSIVSLFMADESGTFHQKCALWIATSQNCPFFFINNLKTAFCPCHSFFSLPSALNYSFSPVQNLYRFEFIVFKKVLWLNVLGYTKRLPHDVIWTQRNVPYVNMEDML